MANVEIKFKDPSHPNDWVLVEGDAHWIVVVTYCRGVQSEILLDKSTAIKFAKTLRTEINKMSESDIYPHPFYSRDKGKGRACEVCGVLESKHID